MANWNEPRRDSELGIQPGFGRQGGVATTVDAGLRRHMLSIYNYMSSGILLSGIVALLAWNSGFAVTIFSTPLRWVVGLAPLAVVFAMSFGQSRFSTGTLRALFWAFAVLMGLSLSSIFAVYSGASIAATFFATAGAFAGLSLFGYTTKKDLSAFGTFLIMGVFGLIIAMVANMFIKSEGLAMAIPFLGVLIFAGLTAFDTQKLKNQYFAIPAEYAGKAVVLGALTLYLDFINMFMFLLRFMGSSRN
ncbi:MAG: Bax inhibitor-1/YccA family protein [Croceibacterium sp.]